MRFASIQHCPTLTVKLLIAVQLLRSELHFTVLIITTRRVPFSTRFLRLRHSQMDHWVRVVVLLVKVIQISAGLLSSTHNTKASTRNECDEDVINRNSESC